MESGRKGYRQVNTHMGDRKKPRVAPRRSSKQPLSRSRLPISFALVHPDFQEISFGTSYRRLWILTKSAALADNNQAPAGSCDYSPSPPVETYTPPREQTQPSIEAAPNRDNATNDVCCARFATTKQTHPSVGNVRQSNSGNVRRPSGIRLEHHASYGAGSGAGSGTGARPGVFLRQYTYSGIPRSAMPIPKPDSRGRAMRVDTTNPEAMTRYSSGSHG
jgi:hypothetical protein